MFSGGATRDDTVCDPAERICLSLKLYHPEPLRHRMDFSCTDLFARPSIRISSIVSSSGASSSSCNKVSYQSGQKPMQALVCIIHRQYRHDSRTARKAGQIPGRQRSYSFWRYLDGDNRQIHAHISDAEDLREV